MREIQKNYSVDPVRCGLSDGHLWIPAVIKTGQYEKLLIFVPVMIRFVGG